MQQTNTYQKQSRIFLTQAFEELERGDLPQASEKGWGAASQMVKANAEERGWHHFSHWTLQRAVSDLSDEADDEELLALFGSAETLHANFYENGYADEAVRYHLGQVVHFVDKAEALLAAAD